MEIQAIQNLVSEMVNRTQFGLQVVTSTIPTMNKTGNPYYGRVKKVSLISGATFAIYANKVNGKLDRKGISVDFTADRHPYAQSMRGALEHIVYENKKNPAQKYLKLCGILASMDFDNTYLIDGRIATDEEVADIRNKWEKKSHSSAKQSACGLEGDEQVYFALPKLENVVFISTDKASATTAKNAYIAQVASEVIVTATATK